ncbi:MAG TPA: hypothetical protein VF668_10635 [Pyrinomonadaceae bacterium]|jgi:Tfp pilus assembly protein PilV
MRTHNSRRRADGAAARPAGGFTILETVIALFVAMVVGFGAISLFIFSANFNAGAADRARALALAQETIEGYRAKAYAALDITDVTTAVNVGSTTAGESDRRTFNVTKKVEYDTAVSNNKQKKITVTVTPVANGRWTGGGVTLVMLRASDVAGGL